MLGISSAGRSAKRPMQVLSLMLWSGDLHDRLPFHSEGLIHHSDRGSQYVCIKYTDRLVGASIEPSVGSIGDSYDNALAETINGLYKAEVIHRGGPVVHGITAKTLILLL